jgi:hypothetical protein
MLAIAMLIVPLFSLPAVCAAQTVELKACQSESCSSYCSKLKLSAKLTGECVGECKRLCTVAPLGRYVTLTSNDLFYAILLKLSGTSLSVDTTQTAPPQDGPKISYPNPAWIACGKELNACAAGPIAERKECAERVNAECKNVPQSILAPQLFYSYLIFPPAANQPTIFLDVKTIPYRSDLHNFNIDLNYINWTLNASNYLVGFSPGAASNSAPTAFFTMQAIKSNTPTIHLSGDLPNVNLTQMQDTITLSGWTVANNGKSVDYGQPTSDFTFDWNLTSFPNWPAGDILGVHDKIANAANSAIVSAFSQDSAHQAISAAVSAAIASKVTSIAKKDGSTITKIVGQGSNWLVYYNPPAPANGNPEGGVVSGKP